MAALLLVLVVVALTVGASAIEDRHRHPRLLQLDRGELECAECGTTATVIVDDVPLCEPCADYHERENYP